MVIYGLSSNPHFPICGQKLKNYPESWCVQAYKDREKPGDNIILAMR